MLISPLQILRERVAENVTNTLNGLKNPKTWLKAIFKNIMKG